MIKQPGTYTDFNDPQALPRYTGIATFFRTPLTHDLSEADIGVIGVPFDGGVTNRSGTRHGPRAGRENPGLAISWRRRNFPGRCCGRASFPLRR